MNTKDMLWLLGGVAAIIAVNFAQSQGILPTPAVATPLSSYPELAYTATTSMAATGSQQAPAAVVPQSPYYSTVQQQEQSAIYTQCVGANVCSPLAADTQLGL